MSNAGRDHFKHLSVEDLENPLKYYRGYHVGRGLRGSRTVLRSQDPRSNSRSHRETHVVDKSPKSQHLNPARVDTALEHLGRDMRWLCSVMARHDFEEMIRVHLSTGYYGESGWWAIKESLCNNLRQSWDWLCREGDGKDDPCCEKWHISKVVAPVEYRKGPVIGVYDHKYPESATFCYNCGSKLPPTE